MKKISFLIFIVLANTLFSQVDTKSNQRIELTSLIKSTLVLADTMTSATILSKYYNMDEYKKSSNILYLDSMKFKIFVNQFKKMFYNKGVIISTMEYSNIETNRSKVLDYYRNCDTVVISEYDSKGNIMDVKRNSCDSTTFFENIIRVEFYERWFINIQNGMIEKEVIAYTPLRQVELDFVKPRFTVYKDEESLRLITENSQ